MIKPLDHVIPGLVLGHQLFQTSLVTKLSQFSLTFNKLKTNPNLEYTQYTDSLQVQQGAKRLLLQSE